MSTHNFKKGAQWLKCDLHIHTPETKLNNQGFEIQDDDKWKKFCQVIEHSDVQVFGITDYFSAENYFKFIKLFISLYPNSNKVFFINIEFRLDVSVNKAAEEINLHVLFSNQVAETGINDFLSKLDTTITKNQVPITCNKLMGENDFKQASIKYTDLKTALKKVFGEEECYKIFAASNNQGLRADSKSPRKLSISDEIDKICHGFFGNSNNIRYFLDENRYELFGDGTREPAKKCPVFTGSDAHSFIDIENKLGKIYEKRDDKSGKICDSSEVTWIKADPTFDGLKQVLIEPEERVYIGKTPPIIEKVNNNRTKYIKSLSIDWVSNYYGKNGTWFKQVEIELNHELVAIIGNKGSGKSALADIIGLCGEYKNEDEFSFLHKDKFRKGSLAKNFEAKLNWEGNSDNLKKLSDKNSNDGIETVKYLPQGYFEKLTNEISTVTSFQKEIENVVFTHISNEDKLGFQSFNELIEHHKAGVEREVSLLIASLIDLNTKIIKLERKINPSYKSEIENKLKQKENELAALTEPPLVENPAEDEAVKLQNSKILSEVNQLSIDIEEIELEIDKKEDEKDKLLTELRELADFKKEVEFKISEIKSFKEQKVSIIKEYNLNFDVLLGITSDFESLTTLINSKENELSSIKKLLEEEVLSEPDFITLKKKLNVAQEQLKDKQKQLDSPLLQYQIYLQEVKNWKEKKSKIVGNESTLDTISFFQKELDYLRNSLEGELQRQRESRLNISEKIFYKKQEVIAIYKDVKQKIDSIIVDNSELLDSYKINIDAKLSFDNRFRATFFNNILQNQVGTFYSNDGGNTQLNSIIQDIDFDSKTGVGTFLTNIVDAIFLDKRDSQNGAKRYPENQIKDQLKLYNELFSLSFLDYNYQLMQSGKTLQQLSPGERGALLLIFYLLLDKDNKPLIIDQPEDNLDNHSVANILVPFIRKAKTNRQIILVTHNPNLAVVSDAEQIIFVNIDKEDNYTFEYISGSIENREINKRIVQVLEGAMPAFNKRKLKYYES